MTKDKRPSDSGAECGLQMPVGRSVTVVSPQGEDSDAGSWMRRSSSGGSHTRGRSARKRRLGRQGSTRELLAEERDCLPGLECDEAAKAAAVPDRIIVSIKCNSGMDLEQPDEEDEEEEEDDVPDNKTPTQLRRFLSTSGVRPGSDPSVTAAPAVLVGPAEQAELAPAAAFGGGGPQRRPDRSCTPSPSSHALPSTRRTSASTGQSTNSAAAAPSPAPVPSPIVPTHLSPKQPDSPQRGDGSLPAVVDDPDDILKKHRVKRFVPPSDLDRSRVDLSLEHEFIAAVNAGRVDGRNSAVALMREEVTTGRLVLTTEALSVALRTRDFRLVKAMLLYPYVDFSTRARMPVTEAVLLGDVRILRLLLLGPVSDVNKGCPLARAVDSGCLEMVRVLADSERVNPNRGGALYRAVASGNTEIVNAVLGSHRINVNKFSVGTGTTALCCAINKQSIRMMTRLLSHPKIDINRGFLLTPLQHAVETANPEVVSTLLNATVPTPLDPNKCLGPTHPPLQMAVERRLANPPSRSGGGDPFLTIARLLLSDRSCLVTDPLRKMIDRGELVEVEQAIVDSGRSLAFSDMWRQRVMLMLMDTILTVGATVYAIILACSYAHHGFRWAAAVTLAVVLLGGVAACLLLVNTAPRPYRGYPCLRALPCLYELHVLLLAMASMCGQAPKKRAQLYKALMLNGRASAMCHSCPQLVAQAVLSSAIGTKDSVGGLLPVVFFCAVFQAVCVGRLAVTSAVAKCSDCGLKKTVTGMLRQPARAPQRAEPVAVPMRRMEPAPRPPAGAAVGPDSRSSRRMSGSSVRRQRPPQLDLLVVRAHQRAVLLPPRCVAAEERERQQRQRQQQQRQAV